MVCIFGAMAAEFHLNLPQSMSPDIVKVIAVKIRSILDENVLENTSNQCVIKNPCCIPFMTYWICTQDLSFPGHKANQSESTSSPNR